MSTLIFQTKNTRYPDEFTTVAEMLRLNKNFDLVATIDADDLDDAYKLSNSINSSWFEGDKVSLEEDGKRIIGEYGGIRSTMVGDVFAIDAVFFLVDEYGFKELK